VRELADHLRALIGRDGPISVARYMAEVLGHPEFGYYRRADPLGAAGDFITAPEVSQVFGELLGAWCAVVWQQMGRPDPVRLAEIGPGRGTLMADALRLLRKTAPGVRDAATLHLVETSPALRDKQIEALAGEDAHWHAALADVPPGPLLLIANEFFDALPVQQFEHTADGWRERLVDRDGEDFRFVLSGTITSPPIALDDAGNVFEICTEARELAGAIGARVARDGGAAIVIDYGHRTSGAGDTLQAVRGHRYHGVLDEPGSADLTAHVDFEALGHAARDAGALVYGPVPQGLFLERLGLRERTEVLCQSASDAQAADVRAASRRLIAASEMGSLFQALAIASPKQPPPPGFDDHP